jgi:hypothetical protein
MADDFFLEINRMLYKSKFTANDRDRYDTALRGFSKIS